MGHIETVTAPPLVSLSERDSIHFCPFCGSDLRPSPCRECGEAMEARWQFCASCGAGVRD